MRMLLVNLSSHNFSNPTTGKRRWGTTRHFDHPRGKSNLYSFDLFPKLLDWSVDELFLNLTCSFQHMIVAGVEAVGQSKLAEERISDDLDDRFALRVTDIFHRFLPNRQDSGLLGPLQRSLNYMRTTFRCTCS